MTFTPEVVVAGAGPVGLVAALTLARTGVRVLVAEKREGLSAASLASTLHPPTLEILDGLGVLSRVQHEGVIADRIQYRSPDGIFAEFAMGSLAAETRFPFRLHLEQSRITPVIVERLQALPNAVVAFGREVTGVTQTGDCVAVCMVGPDGPTQVHARFLLAADGARSTVRAALGLSFEGIDYPDKILRVMTTDDLDAMLPGLAPTTYVFNGARSVSFLKMPDCWRMILRVPRQIEDIEAMDEAWILAQMQAVLPGCTRLPAVVGRDVYGASRRVASRFGVGRVFIIGDAAHVTNTRGGMNMNCGIHDAAAVGGAIAAALADGNDPAFVHGVAAERRRIAAEVLIPRTDRTVVSGPAWADSIRHTAADAKAAAAYLRTAAMLDMLERKAAYV